MFMLLLNIVGFEVEVSGLFPPSSWILKTNPYPVLLKSQSESVVVLIVGSVPINNLSLVNPGKKL